MGECRGGRRVLPLHTALLLLLTILIPSPAAYAQLTYAGKRALTLDDVFGPAHPLPSWGSLPYITGWAVPDPKNGPRYFEFADNGAGEVQLMRVDARTGVSSPLFDALRMEAALTALPGIDAAAAHRMAYRESYTLNAGETAALLENGGALYLYNFQSGRAVRVTDPDAHGNAANESFSPDGARIAFVRGGDLYAVNLISPGKEHRLTRDGSPRILNGRLDWVYEEEVYGRGKTDGYAWSPDGRRIVFLHLDESAVHRFALINSVPSEQVIEEQFYPRPGDPNPIVALGIAVVDDKTPPHFVDLSVYPDQDRLIVRFGWTPDGARIYCEAQDRAQTSLDLLTADPSTGLTVRLFRETPGVGGHWVDPIDSNPLFLKDGTFLWQSDRSGFRHLYRYRANGTLLGPLTHGEWDIRTLFGVDPANSFVYFSAGEHSPLATHVYRLPLPAAGPADTQPQRLTNAEGSHAARFDPTFTYFTDQWSGFDTPPHLRVAETAAGSDVRILGDSADTIHQLAPYRFGRPEFLQVRTRDGFPMEAVLIRPPDFDSSKKYPVFCPVYGGPGAQTVKDEWSGRDFLFYQLLAEKGYIVWMCDNRSASAKGVRSQWPIYRNLGVSELADMEDGLAYLKAQPWVDQSRIGLFGWSYGGFLAEYALTHSKSFKIGISAAGVSDWRLYDSIYTERYLDTPERDPDGYRSSSAVLAAGDCSGTLLLLHGQMDDNVHSQNTLQLAGALEKAGKRFDLMIYPGPEARHGFADSQLDRHLNEIIVDFILHNL